MNSVEGKKHPTYRTKKVKCAVCGTESKQIDIKYIRKILNKKETLLYIDGKPQNESIELYTYQMCPYCGYTGYDIRKQNINKTFKKMGKSFQRLFYDDYTPDFIKRQILYYILNEDAEYKTALRISWYYEDIEDYKTMEKFLKMQIRYCEEVIKENNQKYGNDFTDCYDSYLWYYKTIAECYRRLGDFDTALKYINEQKEIKDEKTFGKNGRINTRESIEKIETACINKNSQRI